jgi:hypothetical protein
MVASLWDFQESCQEVKRHRKNFDWEAGKVPFCLIFKVLVLIGLAYAIAAPKSWVVEFTRDTSSGTKCEVIRPPNSHFEVVTGQAGVELDLATLGSGFDIRLAM